MKAPEGLRRLARDGLREIAAREFKAKGPRMDAVFYLLDALKLFKNKSLQEIKRFSRRSLTFSGAFSKVVPKDSL